MMNCMAVSCGLYDSPSTGINCPIDKDTREVYDSVLNSIPRHVPDKGALIDRFERRNSGDLDRSSDDQRFDTVALIRHTLKSLQFPNGFSMDEFCDLDNHENLAFMATAYSRSRTRKGLQMKIIEHCGYQWIDRVLEVEREFLSLGDNYDRLRSLIDFGILAALNTENLNTFRPYSAKELHRLANEFNHLGVIMYMQNFDTAAELLKLDKNLQNPSLTESDYREAYGATVMPLCGTLCHRLQGQAHAFAKSLLMQCLEHSRRTSSDDRDPILNPRVEEILTAAYMCCELAPPFDNRITLSGKNFYTATFNLIKGSSSPRMTKTNSLKLAQITQITHPDQ